MVRRWNKRDIFTLYTCAETVSQKAAGEMLGRSWQEVARKARSLGIVWRRGCYSYADVSRMAGCSKSTVSRLAQILWPDGPPCYETGRGRRARFSWDDVQRLIRVLERNLARREHKRRAGRARQAQKKEQAQQQAGQVGP